MNSPIELDHHPLTVGASVGVAIYPDQGSTPDALLAAADAAMYQHKAERKSQQVGSPSSNQ